MSPWQEYKKNLVSSAPLKPSHFDKNASFSSPSWDTIGFKHISFEERHSPYTSYTSNFASEYASPELASYSFNIHNFRSKDFHENTNTVTLGCSHTFGVGVPENLIWPSVVGELTGIDDVVNLGKSGSSIALQVRMLATYVRTFGAPKMVLCNFPEIVRYQHITESGEIVDGNTYMGMADNSYTNEQASTQSILALGDLEAICNTNGIVLRWQMWPGTSKNFEDKLLNSFTSYVKNKYTADYLHMQNFYIDYETNEICGDYSHGSWPEECCSDLRKRSNGCFNYGYDRYSVPRKYQKPGLIIEKNELEKLKKSTLGIRGTLPVAHFGSHAHFHWAKNLVESL
jgi:hypothetical protein